MGISLNVNRDFIQRRPNCEAKGMIDWTTRQMPCQLGCTAVITGTGGLALEYAFALAEAGACVILAGRNRGKGEDAVARVRQRTPDAHVRFEFVDLGNLRSIAELADRLRADLESLDLLINNAAVMTPPRRGITSNGFELQLGINYLGHFALTGRLLPLLREAACPRVVTLSSVAARDAAIQFDDLQSERTYQPMAAYGQSKLACLMFALKLQLKSDAGGWNLASVAAHPGICRTDLIPNGAGPTSVPGLVRRYLWFLFQPAAQGALPILYAATAPDAQSGRYYGPDRLGETRGHPALARIPEQALDMGGAARLWKASEELTGILFK